MARIIWVVALLVATLALGGCAGLPWSLRLCLMAAGGGYGGGTAVTAGGYGGGLRPGLRAGGVPIPLPMDPGYGGGYGGGLLPRGNPITRPNLMAITTGTDMYQYGPQGGYPGQQHPQWSADEVNQRLQHQQDRLQAGINSGQITPEESQRLQAEQTRIQAAMTHMQADGNLNP